jgi:hypothetical protein
MDIIAALIGLMLLYIAVWYIKRNQYKRYKTIGDVGESIVSKELNKLGNDYTVMNNVHIGKCQIDHMVICKSTRIIFVIETKLWSGIITGDYNDKQWRQDKNGVVKYLDNPILQNRFHCNTVRKRYKNYKIYSVVCFINSDNVPRYKCIVRVNELARYINNTSNKLCNKDRIDM